MAGALVALAIGAGTLGICAPAWQTRAQAATEHATILEKVEDISKQNANDHAQIKQEIFEQYKEILRRLPPR